MASANINCPLLDLSPDFQSAFIFPTISPPIMGSINDIQTNQADSYATRPLSINVFNDMPNGNDLPPPCIPGQALSINVFNDIPNSNVLNNPSNNILNSSQIHNETPNTINASPPHISTQPLSINVFSDLPNNTFNNPSNSNPKSGNLFNDLPNSNVLNNPSNNILNDSQSHNEIPNASPPHNSTQPLSINVFNDLPNNTFNNPSNSNPKSGNLFNDLPNNIFNNTQNNKDTPSSTQPLSINVFNDLPNNVFKDLPSNVFNEKPNDTPSSYDLPNPQIAAQALSKFYGVNENMLQWSNENFARVQINMMQIPEEQLTVNVDADEGGMHSWRPNLTNSLTSDVFVAQPSSARVEKPKVFSWDSIGEEEKNVEKSPGVVSGAGTDRHRIDVQNHLQAQRTQLNSLKYEVINAKRRLNETQAVVAKLSLELEEKLLFKNSKEMKTLRDENAELRLECQCLCTEVDFYLRGRAPLGEIDENFWASITEDSTADTTSTAQPPITTEQLFHTEEQEEDNKWECRLCTFANHPAITSCEMCHLSRDMKETTQPQPTESCFCHPIKEPDHS